MVDIVDVVGDVLVVGIRYVFVVVVVVGCGFVVGVVWGVGGECMVGVYKFIVWLLLGEDV